jgi:hypothetical protein
VRVLAGGPARETSSPMFQLHLDGLRAQGRQSPEKAGIGGSPSSAPSLEVVVHHEVVPDVGGARWHVEKIENVARARQDMLSKAQIGECYADLSMIVRPPFDGLFLVDTDVILGPGVLERMWAVDADVVHAVYWTPAQWGQPIESDVAPQVWYTSPFRWDANDAAATACWNALCEPGVNEVEVNGGGACTLIRGRGFESRYWPLLESLRGAGGIFPGEDRTYCLGLEARGIRQIAVTGLPVVHLYTEAHRTPAMLARARELVGLTTKEVA